MLYLDGFAPRGASDFFDQSWGFIGGMMCATKGDWRQYSEAEIQDEIYSRAGTRDLEPVKQYGAALKGQAEQLKATLMGLLEQGVADFGGEHLQELRTEAVAIETHVSTNRYAFANAPSSRMSRDADLLAQGVWVPPHITLDAFISSELSALPALKQVRSIAQRAAAYLEERRAITSRVPLSAWTLMNPIYWAWMLISSPIRIPWLVWNDPSRLAPKVLASLVTGAVVALLLWFGVRRFAPTIETGPSVAITVTAGLGVTNLLFSFLKEFKKTS